MGGRWFKKKVYFEDLAHFTQKQEEATKLAYEYDYLLFGGRAGGGKSYFLRWFPIRFLHEYCFKKLGLVGVRAGLFCEDYPALWDRQISKLKYEFPRWLGTYRGQQHEFVLKNKFGGGVLAFRNLDDPSKYLSAEFALVAIDELTKNPRETFDFIRLRKRWPGIKRTKFIAGTNPGEIGHNWVKKLWIDKNYDSNERETNQFYFLPSSYKDNPYLEEEYELVLDSLPEKMRKAYKEGNWDIFEGQYFTEWDREKHIVNPFSIPPSFKKFRAYDHGRESPACCKWYALDHNGRLWVYKELYRKGLNIDQIAQEINNLSVDENYEYSVADPSIFANIGFVDKYGGQTIAESFARHGIVFLPASNRRIDGWSLMHQYLYQDQEKDPKLVYFNTCFDSIRTIPNLIHDKNKPEDLETMGEDHAADCDRYMLLSLHERVAQPPKTEVEKKLERLKEQGPDLNKLYTGQYYRDSFSHNN